VTLLGPADIRAIAARLGVRPTKQLGQNFVHDANTVRRIVRVAGVSPGDRVLEIGPGLGSLTLGLVEAGASVVAVEIDPVLAAELPSTVPGVTVVVEDALRLKELPGEAPTRLVANLPYNVAVPVLLRMLELFPSLSAGLVMVQSEVADRLAAPPGSKVYGVPSVKAAWWASVVAAGGVPRGVFWPVPNVDSSLVAFTRRAAPGDESLRILTFSAIDAAFAQRRKTLRAALSGWAGSAADAETLLRAAGLDPSLRGEQVDVTGFAALARARAASGDVAQLGC
jgi:16S rRNA (adenine1518-N6/adenine1519-N6)-dimethyltransferase